MWCLRLVWETVAGLATADPGRVELAQVLWPHKATRVTVNMRWDDTDALLDQLEARAQSYGLSTQIVDLVMYASGRPRDVIRYARTLIEKS